MPYIDSETVKAKRQAIRALCAAEGVKVSVTKSNHSGVSVTFLSGPFDLRPNGQQERKYATITAHALGQDWDHPFEGRNEARKLVEAVHAVARAGKRTVVVDSDYGAVPNFYVWMQAGKWDKPFTVVGGAS